MREHEEQKKKEEQHRIEQERTREYYNKIEGDEWKKEQERIRERETQREHEREQQETQRLADEQERQQQERQQRLVNEQEQERQRQDEERLKQEQNNQTQEQEEWKKRDTLVLYKGDGITKGRGGTLNENEYYDEHGYRYKVERDHEQNRDVAYLDLKRSGHIRPDDDRFPDLKPKGAPPRVKDYSAVYGKEVEVAEVKEEQERDRNIDRDR